MVCVFGGTLVVGYASLRNSPDGRGDADGASANASASEQTSNSMLVFYGDSLIILAQLAVAAQMCIEERLVAGRDMPALLAVGCEGMWGLLVLGTLLVALQHLPSAGGLPIEDTIDAAVQVRNRPHLMILLLGNSLSIAAFNSLGITITKMSSASYRMVLDSTRTLSVWAIGLAFGGETFHWMQVVGFSLLALGTMLYNEAVRLPCSGAYPSLDERREEEAQQQARRAPHTQLEARILDASPTAAVLKFDDLYSPHLSRWTTQMTK
eukprot:CAMPEP_0119367420 /NCGR_PEP_ID=MMETSP1334-20130426/14197_1 /TAXON_ID=127549 /ORGANISM="Calcidiscus leptoporus, Strain RCC1130" /LENGTH=265 /DNA_ID=CAMNT_0007383823 /DNA_START=491 /DNA_END=1288 /DNA_ORIENTATION=-